MLAELLLIAELLDRSKGVSLVTQQPVAQQPIPKTFAESLQALAYPAGWDADKIVINLTPEAIAIYHQSERIKKALRGL